MRGKGCPLRRRYRALASPGTIPTLPCWLWWWWSRVRCWSWSWGKALCCFLGATLLTSCGVVALQDSVQFVNHASELWRICYVRVFKVVEFAAIIGTVIVQLAVYQVSCIFWPTRAGGAPVRNQFNTF